MKKYKFYLNKSIIFIVFAAVFASYSCEKSDNIVVGVSGKSEIKISSIGLVDDESIDVQDLSSNSAKLASVGKTIQDEVVARDVIKIDDEYNLIAEVVEVNNRPKGYKSISKLAATSIVKVNVRKYRLFVFDQAGTIVPSPDNSPREEGLLYTAVAGGAYTSNDVYSLPNNQSYTFVALAVIDENEDIKLERINANLGYVLTNLRAENLYVKANSLAVAQKAIMWKETINVGTTKVSLDIKFRKIATGIQVGLTSSVGDITGLSVSLGNSYNNSRLANWSLDPKTSLQYDFAGTPSPKESIVFSSLNSSSLLSNESFHFFSTAGFKDLIVINSITIGTKTLTNYSPFLNVTKTLSPGKRYKVNLTVKKGDGYTTLDDYLVVKIGNQVWMRQNLLEHVPAEYSATPDVPGASIYGHYFQWARPSYAVRRENRLLGRPSTFLLTKTYSSPATGANDPCPKPNFRLPTPADYVTLKNNTTYTSVRTQNLTTGYGRLTSKNNSSVIMTFPMQSEIRTQEVASNQGVEWEGFYVAGHGLFVQMRTSQSGTTGAYHPYTLYVQELQNVFIAGGTVYGGTNEQWGYAMSALPVRCISIKTAAEL